MFFHKVKIHAGFDSRRGAPVQYTLLDIDEDDEYEEDCKNNEDDEDDEDENEDENDKEW